MTRFLAGDGILDGTVDETGRSIYPDSPEVPSVGPSSNTGVETDLGPLRRKSWSPRRTLSTPSGRSGTGVKGLSIWFRVLFQDESSVFRSREGTGENGGRREVFTEEDSPGGPYDTRTVFHNPRPCQWRVVVGVAPWPSVHQPSPDTALPGLPSLW